MNLPNGWVSAAVRDVCELRNGRAYSQPELLGHGKYPVLRVGNFFSNPNWYYSDLELEESKYCTAGDLLYAWSASFGPKIWSGPKVIFHYHIWRVDPRPDIVDKQFLFHWFEWDKRRIQADHGTGSTMIHVTKSAMEDRTLALPPLAEQRRIVAKIDTLTARTAAARAELDIVLRLASTYKQALLGSLLEPCAEEISPLSNSIVEGLIGLVRSKSEQSNDEGVSYVRMQHFGLDGRWDFGDLTKVSVSEGEHRRYSLLLGDILFNTRNSAELVGKVALCDKRAAGFVYNNNLLRLRFTPTVLPKFAFLQMQSPQFRLHLEDHKSATTSVAAIYQGALYRTPFWVPSLQQQEAIVLRAEAALAEINRLATEARAARRLLDRLGQSILAKAFRGELVPQDPDDEPASVLLDRIRAERAAAPKSGRRRRGNAGG